MHNQTDIYLQAFFSELNDSNRYQVTSSQWWKMLEQKQKMIQSCVIELFVLVCKMVHQDESWEGTTEAKPFPLNRFNGEHMDWTDMCKVLPKDRIYQKSLKPVAYAKTLPPAKLSSGQVGRARRPPLFLVGAAEQPTDPKIAVMFEGDDTWVRRGGAYKMGWCEFNRNTQQTTPLATFPPLINSPQLPLLLRIFYTTDPHQSSSHTRGGVTKPQN